jgi:hypothetical protein
MTSRLSQQDMFIKRVQQGTPLETLESRMCAAGDVQGSCRNIEERKGGVEFFEERCALGTTNMTLGAVAGMEIEAVMKVRTRMETRTRTNRTAML